jgi:hypothetical protein
MTHVLRIHVVLVGALYAILDWVILELRVMNMDVAQGLPTVEGFKPINILQDYRNLGHSLFQQVSLFKRKIFLIFGINSVDHFMRRASEQCQ